MFVNAFGFSRAIKLVLEWAHSIGHYLINIPSTLPDRHLRYMENEIKAHWLSNLPKEAQGEVIYFFQWRIYLHLLFRNLALL